MLAVIWYYLGNSNIVYVFTSNSWNQIVLQNHQRHLLAKSSKRNSKMPSSLIQTRVRSTSLWFSLLRSSEFQFSRQLKADTTEVVERPYSSEISVVVIGGVWPPSNDRWLPIGVRVPRRLLSTCLHWTLIEKPDNAANKRSSNNWTWLEDIQLHTHCWLLLESGSVIAAAAARLRRRFTSSEKWTDENYSKENDGLPVHAGKILYSCWDGPPGISSRPAFFGWTWFRVGSDNEKVISKLFQIRNL